MELRHAEQEVDDLALTYESLRRDLLLCRETWPSLTRVASPMAPSSGDATSPIMAPSTSTFKTTATKPGTDDLLTSNQSILQSMQDLVDRLQGLQAKMDRFRKRMNEKDPVTDRPRYGQNTLERVKALISRYEEMIQALIQSGVAHVDPVASDIMSLSDESRLVQQIRAAAQLEAEEKARLEQDAIMEQRRQEQMKEQEALQKLEQERLAEVAARNLVEQQRQEATRALEAERLAQRLKQEEADRADREWVASITKGPSGVREQLDILMQSTADDPEAQKTALRSLHTLFAQIVARPEEISFRRIRRDHPRFQEDVGRHPGGRELLIAAGFELGVVDQIPTFISREPDLETDMDRWSSWFELNKATLEIIKAFL